MSNIPDKSVDCIITDLPYGGQTHNKWDVIIPMEDWIVFKDKIAMWNEFLLLAYNNGIPFKEAVKYFEKNRKQGLWTQYKRIIKDNGAIILFANGMFTAKLMMSNKDMWRYNLVWEKTQPTGFLNAKKMPLRNHEDICIFYKKLPTYNPQMSTGHVRKVSKAEHKVNCKATTDYGKH